MLPSGILLQPGHSFRTHALLLALLTGLMVMMTARAEADSALRVHRYATFHETRLDSNAASGNDTRQRTQVTVDGQVMTLALEDNQEVLGDLPHSSRNMQVQRGQLEGRPDSWVRMTRSAQGVNGLIWDGHELYVVAPTSAVTSTGDNAATVIYRLSETSVTLPTDYCGTESSGSASRSTTGLQAYRAMVNELVNDTATVTNGSTSSGEASLRLEMQVLADAAYRAEFTSNDAALAALTARINNVDGIFRNQLGLAVQATDIQVFSSDPPALSDTHDAGTLLNSLALLRSGSGLMGSYPVTHLVTGRDLDGDTLGIAYIGQLCGARYGVSLSEVRNRGVWIDSLVMAHELGHQLGAVHDGTGACASTDAQSYLMSATINGSSDFSECSKQMMRSTMATSACLVPTSVAVQTSTVTDAEPAAGKGGGAFTLTELCCLWLLLALSSMRRPTTAPSRK